MPDYRIRLIDDPILRQPAKKVTQASKAYARIVTGIMAGIVRKANAAGLSAPQIGVPLQIVVTNINGGLMAMSNPEILSTGGELEAGPEECLSIPGVSIEVPRWTVLKVRHEGGVMDFKNFSARVVAHELDHLRGVLIIDYAESMEDIGLAASIQ